MKQLSAQPEVQVDTKDRYGDTPLSCAAHSGHKGIVKLLLAQHEIQVDWKVQDGDTALSYSAQYGHNGIVKLLWHGLKSRLTQRTKMGIHHCCMLLAMGTRAS